VPRYGKRLFGARREGLHCVKEEFVPVQQKSVGLAGGRVLGVRRLKPLLIGLLQIQQRVDACCRLLGDMTLLWGEDETSVLHAQLWAEPVVKAGVIGNCRVSKAFQYRFDSGACGDRMPGLRRARPMEGLRLLELGHLFRTRCRNSQPVLY
jgi:hypothetical protein